MMERARWPQRWREIGSQSGLTLLEILFALGLIGVSLLALAAAFPAGVGGVEAGKQQTTAIFLAEQRLEQIKGTAFASITVGNFPDEPRGTVSCAGIPPCGLPPEYRDRYGREVDITNPAPGMTNALRVDVTVSYRPVLAFGVLLAERRVTTSGLISLH
jgi:type II secretory pathway pseudopilin PulG